MKLKIPRFRNWFIALQVVFGGFVIFLLFWMNTRNALPLPNYGPAPSFELLSQNDQAFSSKSLEGKVWISDFIFTRCPSICPAMNAQMALLKKKLPEVRFVSFTADPKFDTPAVLKKYAEKNHLDTSGWDFLTGGWNQMNQVSKGFKISGPEEPMFHSGALLLVDQAGKIRGYYASEDNVKQLVRDAKQLLRDKPR